MAEVWKTEYRVLKDGEPVKYFEDSVAGGFNSERAKENAIALAKKKAGFEPDGKWTVQECVYYHNDVNEIWPSEDEGE